MKLRIVKDGNGAFKLQERRSHDWPFLGGFWKTLYSHRDAGVLMANLRDRIGSSLESEVLSVEVKG